MDPTDMVPLIEKLNDSIDDLEDALAPLLEKNLSDIANKLPLLDKAQMYVLATFAIESLLFSYLRLNEVDAKEHPIFRELARVKQYFAKITEVETGESKRGSTLDKPAAGRFIKHALAGNEAYDYKRSQQQADEKARAHSRFAERPSKRKADEVESLLPSSSTPKPDETSSNLVQAAGGNTAERLSKHSNDDMVTETSSTKKRKKRSIKRQDSQALAENRRE